jgi:hypothetical protein
MAAEHEISTEYLVGLIDAPTQTEADRKSQTRSLLQVFHDIKNDRARHKGEWNADETFDSIPDEQLNELSKIITEESVDNVVPPSTSLNILGKFVVSYITDTIEERKK